MWQSCSHSMIFKCFYCMLGAKATFKRYILLAYLQTGTILIFFVPLRIWVPQLSVHLRTITCYKIFAFKYMYIFVKYLYKCAVKCKDADGIDPTCDFFSVKFATGANFISSVTKLTKNVKELESVEELQNDLWRAKYQD